MQHVEEGSTLKEKLSRSDHPSKLIYISSNGGHVAEPELSKDPEDNL